MMQVLNKILLASKKLSMAIRILFLQTKDLSSRPFLLFPKINKKSFLGNRIVQPVRSIDDPDAFIFIFGKWRTAKRKKLLPLYIEMNPKEKSPRSSQPFKRIVKQSFAKKGIHLHICGRFWMQTKICRCFIEFNSGKYCVDFISVAPVDSTKKLG